MKNTILLITAIILFGIISPFGIMYTALYYANKETDKGYSYSYRCAFAIDVLANCLFGELFEAALSCERGATSFGRSTSISAATGELIHKGKISRFGKWFSKMLDKAFREKEHCLNAYNKELKTK
jgi:hypothetical protein